METRYIYFNGEIMPLEQAAVSPFDIGLLRGYAVFDLLRTVKGKPFLLAEHLRRLRGSAEQLGLTVPDSDEDISAAIGELLELNRHTEATIRLVLTGGVSPDGLGFDPRSPTFYILTHDLVEPPASLYEQGGKLLTEEHRREVPEAKTTNYLTMLKNRPRAVAEGALDLLYHDGGRIFEAASASFYPVRGNTILAPADCVLWGTVGSLVLDLARERYEVVACDVTLDDALDADEAFLTSTTRGVVPIVRLDEHTIGDGTVGPVTEYLMARWREVVSDG
jgi:branched-chain amino acid aminotransferase